MFAAYFLIVIILVVLLVLILGIENPSRMEAVRIKVRNRE